MVSAVRALHTTGSGALLLFNKPSLSGITLASAFHSLTLDFFDKVEPPSLTLIFEVELFFSDTDLSLILFFVLSLDFCSVTDFLSLTLPLVARVSSISGHLKLDFFFFISLAVKFLKVTALA